MHKDIIPEDIQKFLKLKCVTSGNIQYSYSDHDAEGVPIKKGSQIEKCNSGPGDTYPDGTTGKVIGSAGPFYIPEGESSYMYSVVWGKEYAHYMPELPNEVPMFIHGDRIKKCI